MLAQVFRTDGPVAARYGLVARNRIWFGSTVHWFDQIKQVIFEENTATGISLVSVSRAPRPSCCCSVRIRFMVVCVQGGSNIDTYGSGSEGTYAQVQSQAPRGVLRHLIGP